VLHFPTLCSLFPFCRGHLSPPLKRPLGSSYSPLITLFSFLQKPFFFFLFFCDFFLAFVWALEFLCITLCFFPFCCVVPRTHPHTVGVQELCSCMFRLVFFMLSLRFLFLFAFLFFLHYVDYSRGFFSVLDF